MALKEKIKERYTNTKEKTEIKSNTSSINIEENLF